MTGTKKRKTKTATPAKEKRAKRQAFVVLGMHRSGTSALAGMLNVLGCDQPAQPMDLTDDNQKGYFEAKGLYVLHTNLLKSAGSHWNDWLPMNPDWYNSARAEEYHDQALACMETEFGASRLFVLKDPRICRLLPFWRGVWKSMDIQPNYVLTHRNPTEVAASLSKRDNLNEGHGLLIWLRHVLDAEAQTRGKTRCFVSYDQLLSGWGQVAAKIVDTLKVPLPRLSPGIAPEMDAFLDGKLRHFEKPAHQTLENPMVSAWVRDTYRIMEKWVNTGEASADYKELDAISAALDASTSSFAPIIQYAQQTASAYASSKTQLTELDVLLHENEISNAEVERLTEQLAQTQNELEQRRHEAEQIHLELSEAKQQLSDSRDALSEQTKRAMSLSAEIDQKATKLSSLEQRIDTQHRELADITRIYFDTEKASKQALEEQSIRAQMAEEAAALIRKSTSWKITGPLRGLAKVFGR